MRIERFNEEEAAKTNQYEVGITDHIRAGNASSLH